MASKKSKNKIQSKENPPISSSTRVMQVIFLILSVVLVLSMILAATSSY